MFALKARLGDAENAKNLLVEKGLIDNSYKVKKDSKYIYFPLKKKVSLKGFEVVEEYFEKQSRPVAKDLKELLKERLSGDEFERLKSSYDIVGTIAILEIDEELREKEKVIAEALLESNKTIKTVLRKDAAHGTEFRTQKMKFLAGIDTRETIHKESGVSIKLDVENVYFSPRLSTERKRISEQVKKGESILVMFSGCAPYPCVLSKNTEAKEIFGVEINPAGHKYGLENVKLNKIRNVELINRDVRVEVPKLKKFDRILMPLPKEAQDFLDVAFQAAMKGTKIHFYQFLHEDNFSEAEKKAREEAIKHGFKFKFLDLVKCGQHAPRVYRVCLDFEVS